MKSLSHNTFFLVMGLLGGLCGVLEAGNTFSANKKANALFQKGEYERALEIYEKALAEAPDEPRLRMNKGSALYKLGLFDQAEESYKEAAGIQDKEAKADLYYNAGNAQFMQAMTQAKQGDQQALEKFKGAREAYITSLRLRPSDKDAKWNLEVTNGIIDALEKNQQNQDKNQQNKQNQNNNQKNNDQNESGDQDKENQQQQQEQDGKKEPKDQGQENQQQDPGDQEQQRDGKDKPEDKQEEKGTPKPTRADQKQEEMEKKKAEMLLQKFADDADKLNRPIRVPVQREDAPEKDW